MRANTHTATTSVTGTHRATTVPNASLRTALSAAAILSQPDQPIADPRGLPLKDTLQSLTHQISQLRVAVSDPLSALLTLCRDLKSAEHLLRHAQHNPQVSGELKQLRHALPAFFRHLDQYLHRHHNTVLDIDSLQTLCLGLATLAQPVPGPLLLPQQCHIAQGVLTSLSSELAGQLTARIEQQVTDPGPLLNCLNWFSRALKADMLAGDTPAIRHLFHNALTQLHSWAGNIQADSFNSRQLAKAMVQLNTMVKQQLIRIDPDTEAGRTNRALWAGCVQQLCRHFLSSDQWLTQCSGIELINVTNTLKDGLEQRLLDAGNADLTTAFGLIASRLQAQSFTGADQLTSLSNSANFLRCLFEHNRLGDRASPGGQAAWHLLGEIDQLSQHDGFNGSHAQALVNLASYLKAIDRWLAVQPPVASSGAWAPLAQASTALVTALQRLGVSDPRWMRSPESSSALLSALQHLGQRGLLKNQPSAPMQALVMQLVEAIPDGAVKARHSQSLLQSLRSLMALCQRPVAGMALPVGPVFGAALTSLLTRLQQQLPAPMSDDERLACLQAAQTGIALGTLSIDEVQPLLQHLLRTRMPVDLDQLAQAIRQAGESVEVVDVLSLQAVDPTGTDTTIAAEKPAKVRGSTYRGEVPSPKPVPAPSTHLITAGHTDWLTPRHTLKPSEVPASGTVALSVLTTTPATKPTLSSRSAAGKKNRAAAERMAPVPASATPAASTALVKNDKAGLMPAQKEWFALLEQGDPKALPRLQELVTAYPDLLNQKSAGKKGQSALFYALMHGRKEIVTWLLAQPSSDATADLGALLCELLNRIGLVEKRHLAVIRLLLEAAVKRHDQQTSDDHAQQPPGAQPLSRKALLERRVNMIKAEYKDTLDQFTALQPLLQEFKLMTPAQVSKAADKQDPEKPVRPTSHRANTHARPQADQPAAALQNAAASTDNEGIQSAFSPVERPGELAMQRESLRLNTLMVAIEQNYPDTVKGILNIAKDKDAFARMRSDHRYGGMTALMRAAIFGGTDILMSIFNAVSDKDALAQMQSDEGQTALMYAANGGDTKKVIAIFNTVNDPDTLARIQDNQGVTALIRASNKGNTDVVGVIMKAVGDPDSLARMKDARGRTALSYAASAGHADTVRMLLKFVKDKDAYVRTKAIGDVTPLHAAALIGATETVGTLLGAANDKDSLAQMQDQSGLNVLARAALGGHTDTAVLILNSVINKRRLAMSPDNSGRISIFLADFAGHHDTALAITRIITGDM